MHDQGKTIKQILLTLLDSNDAGQIASLAREHRQILSHLVRTAYDKETLIGWRAIKAIGVASRELLRTNYDFLRETVRKQLWSLTDESGGIGWSAPEIIGKIVSADPDRFSDIIPLVAGVYDIEEAVFRPGVLYALSRVAETHPSMVERYSALAIRSLSDENPLTRFYGLELIKNLNPGLGGKKKEAIKDLLPRLVVDTAEVWVYLDGNFNNLQVGEAAKTLKL